MMFCLTVNASIFVAAFEALKLSMEKRKFDVFHSFCFST